MKQLLLLCHCTNWILTKQRCCSLRFAVSCKKSAGRMVMTYCQQLALIDIEMKPACWQVGPVSNGRAALLNSGRLSGMWSNAIRNASRPYRSANPGFLAFNWVWSLLDSSPLSLCWDQTKKCVPRLFPILLVLWRIWDQPLWTCEGHVWFINISIL